MRKKSTRLLSAALAVCMTVTVLPMSAFASGVAEVSPQETAAAQSEETGDVTGDVAIDEEHFPDLNFRKFVKQKFDTNGDDFLSQSERAAVKELDCHKNLYASDGEKIKSLKGIEYFTSLKKLNCEWNQLSALDVSNSPALEELNCDKNQLSALDVSANPALKELSCAANQLSALDVSANPALKELYCSGNQLSALDVSNNLALEKLEYSYNKLSALDLSNNQKLTDLFGHSNHLSALDVSNNPALKKLYCSSNYLSALDVSANPALEELDCSGNQLSALDVSANSALKELYCSGNQLSALDVSANLALKKLSCYENQLTSLDIDGSNIGSFNCWDNSYNIVVDETNRYDLSKLPGNFDASKVEALVGGRLEGNSLIVNEDAPKITYTYNCGTNTSDKIKKANFTLNVIRHNHTYDGWTRDETNHWHECIAPNCPEREKSVKDKAEHTFDEDGVCTVCGYQQEPAAPDAPAGGSGTGNIQGALSAVVVGAAAGVIIYEAGTGIYRVINMPGIPMPSNRIELAELLWEHAGKPEPVSTALYSDIDEGDTDAQKAARWAVEQDLMKDDADNNKFNPYFPVSKLRTCLTWNAAKEKGLFDKTEE